MTTSSDTESKTTSKSTAYGVDSYVVFLEVV